MVKFSYKKARGWIMLSSRCPWIQESRKVIEQGCHRTVAQAVKCDKRKSSCRYNYFVAICCLEGNALYTQSLALSCIWTQLPYGHELSIDPNLSRNLKTRQCFWREASFPKEKYCTHAHVHTERCPGKNAHYSDTAFEQTAPQSLVNRGAQTWHTHTPRHHCWLPYSPAFTWACPSDLLRNTNKALHSSPLAKQQQNLRFLRP